MEPKPLSKEEREAANTLPTAMENYNASPYWIDVVEKLLAAESYWRGLVKNVDLKDHVEYCPFCDEPCYGQYTKHAADCPCALAKADSVRIAGQPR